MHEFFVKFHADLSSKWYKKLDMILGVEVYNLPQTCTISTNFTKNINQLLHTNTD